MQNTIYITGHKNPDSDSICAAIAYADYKNSSGSELKAIPIRLGEINLETKFILDYFKVEAPKYIDTVRLSVEDLAFDKVQSISEDISLRMALNIMKRDNFGSLPVVDDDGRLIGIVTISDIIQNYIDVWDNTILGKANTSIENIVDTLAATPIYIPEKLKPLTGKVSIFAMEVGSIKGNNYSNDVAIMGNRREVEEFAIESNVSLMIITGDGVMDEDLIEDAKKKGIAVISTSYDTFMTSRLITQSIPVKYTMTNKDIKYFSLEDLVDDVKEKMSQTRFRAYPVVDNDMKVVGLISRYHLISNTKKKVILVDHNERSQSIDGLEESEILEIIDHHRVADVFTGNPIYFRNEPVGSTSTIIASIMFENGRRPSKKIAGIMAAAIISDTLLMRSPTSTNVDRMILERLAKIADIDVEKFSQEMFKAGTSLTGRTPVELLNQDFKAFTILDELVGISQIFTMDADSLNNMKEDLLNEMESRAKENNYSIYILMLTDIFNEASEMVVVGKNKDILAKAFGKELKNHSFYAPGVLSRKKQVVPPLSNALSEVKNN